jgi:response regulator RpfG family c-di-GMP phosphodiesterase
MMHDRPASAGSSQQRTVLVVDDDPASVSYLADALEGLGCHVLAATDAGEALRILMETPPDLIFTDLMMPGVDGLEFSALARTHLPGLPLVLVTACDQKEAAAEAIGSGATAFLRKPVSLADLATVLEQLSASSGTESSSLPAPPRQAGRRDGSRSNGAGGAATAEQERIPARPDGVKGAGSLDPALLRKATQFSLLSRFGSDLRELSLSGASVPISEMEDRAGIPGIGSLVRGSLDIVLRALPGDRALLALMEEGRVEVIACRGGEDPPLPVEKVAAHLQESESGHPWHGVLEGMPLLAAPLSIQGANAAIICLGRDPGGPPFTWADGELLAAFSVQTAISLETACLGRQLEQAFQETVTSLVVTLEARDKYTEGHSLRVADYAAGIAAALGLPGTARAQVRTTSLLHDLGKVGVRDDVLSKPGRLTPEESAAMRQHPVLGWKILGRLGFLTMEAQGVRHHHEHFDGTGYPDGLARETIPLLGRIIAVGDSFDAMTTPRPYRLPGSAENAMLEIRRGAGTQFDPAVADAFQAWCEGWCIQHRAALRVS